MYLLAYLINNDNYIKIDDLCDFLYVSKSTLSNALKKVDEILEQYGIHIERRPNYGIKAIGDEINFRRCMSDYFVKRNSLGIDENIEEVEARDKIADILYQLMNKYNVNMSETGFQNLVDNISVGIRRMKRGKYIHFADDSLLKPSNIVHFMVGELTRDLQGIFEIEYSEDEKNYIEVLLAGRRMVGDGKRDEINFVIHENIDQLVMDMLELIYQTYRIDLRSNFEVRMSLNQHLVPLDIRMRYHIPLENPMLNEIKDEYMFPFTMASQVSAILSDYYHRVIPEGEIGYLALIFALALEQQKNPDYSKYNILIVCSSGKGSARLLMYKYQQTFGKYINQIYLCNQFELNGFDFSKVQYVFTTIPIVQKIPVPILEIGTLLGKDDISNVWKIFQSGNGEYLENYYKEYAFMPHMKGTTKEEVIQNMCEYVQNHRTLPEGFCEAIIKREELASTDFGNLIAFCHPYKVMTKDTFVYVGILDEPIMWKRNDVQVVFLISIGEQEDENIQRFYETTTRFFLQEDAVKQLIEVRTFRTLMHILNEIEAD
jgi:lichenan operon transcriptional antiterminator